MGQEKYTAKTLAALQAAQQLAAMKYHQEITSAHTLLALAKEPEGLLATIFSDCQTDLPMLKARREQVLNKIPSVKGTDRLGMDLLSYMIYGARTSVILCVCCTILSTLLSLVIGVLSAVIGGWFDLIVQRIVDAFGCIPQMLLLPVIFFCIHVTYGLGTLVGFIRGIGRGF